VDTERLEDNCCFTFGLEEEYLPPRAKLLGFWPETASKVHQAAQEVHLDLERPTPSLADQIQVSALGQIADGAHGHAFGKKGFYDYLHQSLRYWISQQRIEQKFFAKKHPCMSSHKKRPLCHIVWCPRRSRLWMHGGRSLERGKCFCPQVVNLPLLDWKRLWLVILEAFFHAFCRHWKERRCLFTQIKKDQSSAGYCQSPFSLLSSRSRADSNSRSQRAPLSAWERRSPQRMSSALRRFRPASLCSNLWVRESEASPVLHTSYADMELPYDRATLQIPPIALLSIGAVSRARVIRQPLCWTEPSPSTLLK